MDRSFVEENAKERERLISLVSNITDEDLRRPLGTGWTIAIALGHLAFWDQRSLFMIRKWKKSGVVASSPIDVDITNDALLPLLRALPPCTAAEQAVSAAEEIDRELENVSAELIAKIEGIGERNRLYRSVHRKLHLDQIEECLHRRGPV